MTINRDLFDYTIDQNSLTFRDGRDFKILAKVDLAVAMGEKPLIDDGGNVIKDDRGKPIKTVQPSLEHIAILLYLTNRKRQPELTLDDVLDLPLSSLEVASAASESADDEGKVLLA